jgi:DNA-binding FadR family transcriptional regulator
VAEQILDQIRMGAISPGDQLPTEKELMHQLGVGRSSVREGLQILATLNLIESRPGVGAFLRVLKPGDHIRLDLFGPLMSNTDAFGLLEARQMIEPSAVRLACTRATEADFARVEALLDEHMHLLRSGQPAHECAAKFHVLLAECSHNQIAANFMSSIMGLLMARGRKIDRIPGYAEREIEEHRVLLGLVRARDPEAASAAMAAHIVASAQTYDVDLGGEFDGMPIGGIKSESVGGPSD